MQLTLNGATSDARHKARLPSTLNVPKRPYVSGRLRKAGLPGVAYALPTAAVADDAIRPFGPCIPAGNDVVAGDKLASEEFVPSRPRARSD